MVSRYINRRATKGATSLLDTLEAALPVAPLVFKLDLCGVEASASLGMAQRASKPSEGFLAGSDSSTHCPYRSLYATALGFRVRAWVGKLRGHLGNEVGNFLGCLGIRLLGPYLVTNNAIVRPANPSMGFRPANTTSPASSPAALGDSESVADIVLG